MECVPETVAWVTSVSALNGIRVSTALSHGELHEDEALDWSTPNRLNCVDNKGRRHKRHTADLSWPELLDAIGQIRMSTLPDELRECASPRERPSTIAKQKITERYLSRVANWFETHFGKDLSMEEHEAVRFVPFSHLAAFQPFDLKGPRDSGMSELLRTSPFILEKIYSSSQRFSADDGRTRRGVE